MSTRLDRTRLDRRRLDRTSTYARATALLAAAAVGLVAATVAAGASAAAAPSGMSASAASSAPQAPTAAVAAPTAVAADALPAGAPGSLVWSDEFEGPAGTAPDATSWAYDLGAGGWGNNEYETYTDSRANSQLDGEGNLVITARKGTDGSYTSARLKTQSLRSFQYGHVEARIKIPRGQGIWPAFWMLGETSSGGVDWPTSGEIDIMENIGREPDQVHGTVHGPGYSGDAGPSGTYTLPHAGAFYEDFHTYAVDWQPGSITWYVDGNEYFHVTPDTDKVSGNPWAFDGHPFFIILNVAVGGYWPGYPDSTTTFPQAMTVDYVRVYDGSGPVPRQSTTTSLTVTPTATTAGQQVTLDAAVSETSATGTIEFFDGATSLGTRPAVSGAASLRTSSLTVGDHSITATYSGDDDHEPSTSEARTIAVAPAPPTKQAARLAVRPSAIRVTVGDPVALTATVVTGATGVVEFFDGGASLGRAPIENGVATAWTNGLVVGRHAVTATYLGDSAHARATSSTTFTVVKAKPSAVKVKAKRFVRGTRPRITVKVGLLPDGDRPVGKVKVHVGKKVVRTVRLTARKRGKVTVRLAKSYRKAIKVRATFVPKQKATVAKKTSKKLTVKPRK